MMEEERNMKPAPSRMDRMYHDSEAFLYRYRWWIVLILVLLLAWYLYTKRSDIGKMYTDVTASSNPRLGSTELNIGTPTTTGINTDARNLFRL